METKVSRFPTARLTYKNFFSIKGMETRKPVKVYDMELNICLQRCTFPKINKDCFTIAISSLGETSESKKISVRTYIQKGERKFFSSKVLVESCSKMYEVVWRVNRKNLLKRYDSLKETAGEDETLTITLRFGPEFEYKIGIEDPRSDWQTLSEAYGNFLKTGISDVILKCDKRRFGAHIDFLIARCGMFGKSLRDPNDIYEISKLKPAALESFLQYVYTGYMEDLPIDFRNDIYEFGKEFDIKNILYAYIRHELEVNVQ